jgi:phosphoglycolate phosphatase
MRRIEAVIFDFDYTLADSSRGAVECVNCALAALGLPMASSEAICQTIGLSLTDTLARLAGPGFAERSQEFAGQFTKRADEVMADLTVLYENVAPVVLALKQRGIKLGIVSTKFRRRIEGILRREHLADVFDAIVGGEDVFRHKPDPESLWKAIERLSVPASQVVYVGDSLVDAETARRAGVAFVAVLSGQTQRGEFDGYPVDGMIECLPQLLACQCIE